MHNAVHPEERLAPLLERVLNIKQDEAVSTALLVASSDRNLSERLISSLSGASAPSWNTPTTEAARLLEMLDDLSTRIPGPGFDTLRSAFVEKVGRDVLPTLDTAIEEMGTCSAPNRHAGLEMRRTLGLLSRLGRDAQIEQSTERMIQATLDRITKELTALEAGPEKEKLARLDQLLTRFRTYRDQPDFDPAAIVSAKLREEPLQGRVLKILDCDMHTRVAEGNYNLSELKEHALRIFGLGGAQADPALRQALEAVIDRRTADNELKLVTADDTPRPSVTDFFFWAKTVHDRACALKIPIPEGWEAALRATLDPALRSEQQRAIRDGDGAMKRACWRALLHLALGSDLFTPIESRTWRGNPGTKLGVFLVDYFGGIGTASVTDALGLPAEEQRRRENSLF